MVNEFQPPTEHAQNEEHKSKRGKFFGNASKADLNLKVAPFLISFFIIFLVLLGVSIFFNDQITDTGYFVDSEMAAEKFVEEQTTLQTALDISEINEKTIKKEKKPFQSALSNMGASETPLADNEIILNEAVELAEQNEKSDDLKDGWYIQLGVCNFNECVERIRAKIDPYLYSITTKKTIKNFPLLTLTTKNKYKKSTAENLALFINSKFDNGFNAIIRKVEQEKEQEQKQEQKQEENQEENQAQDQNQALKQENEQGQALKQETEQVQAQKKQGNEQGQAQQEEAYQLFLGIYSSIEQAKRDRNIIESEVQLEKMKLKIDLVKRSIENVTIMTGPFKDQQIALQNQHEIRNVVGIEDAFVIKQDE